MRSDLLLYGLLGFLFFALLVGPACSQRVATREQAPPCDSCQSTPPPTPSTSITIFMAGDVMTGRGIDQVLSHPSDPLIHEPCMQSAQGYVDLAEQTSGPMPQPVDFAYIWGDALEEWERVRPDARLINLETSVTTSNDYWTGKEVHYRMHPQNVPSLTAAKIDFCSLANNHVLDWGYAGLAETLETLDKANIHTAGAGQDLQQAETPAVLEVEGKGRVIVFSYGFATSGIPISWTASADEPGVNLLADLSDQTVQHIKAKVEEVEQPGDVVVASIHWGSHWGYDIPPEQSGFARQLIDEAGVDVVHGHSSHHVKGIEVYQGKPIIYGAGDFLNEYEGIGGYEHFRPDLVLMYFVSVDPATGKLIHLQMTPMQIMHFKVNRASSADALWLTDVLNREGEQFGTRAEINPDGILALRWD
jgi:poly-gamma-glutamate capsule biosynthesis protein CapA/YwtB (metallophosphatase superfamily)